MEHFNFNIGNAIKYLWRQGLKANSLEDLEKAVWYINREIERRTKDGVGADRTVVNDGPNGEL